MASIQRVCDRTCTYAARPTGSMPDAAPNEAYERGTPRDSTMASECNLQWKACRRPLQQNHVGRPVTSIEIGEAHGNRQ